MPGVDVETVLSTQRTAAVLALQELTRLEHTGADADLSRQLVLESMIFRPEAEIRWLDHCEARLRRAQSSTSCSPPGSATPGSTLAESERIDADDPIRTEAR